MLPEVDEQIRRTVERLAEEVDPGDALARVRRRKARRSLIRRVKATAMVVVMLAATGGGIFTLARLFGLGQPRPVAVPQDPMLAFVSDRDGDADIYVLGEDGRPVNLTNNDVDDLVPTWSPDGTKIAFLRRAGGAFHVHVMSSDGTGSTRLTEPEPGGVAAGVASEGGYWFSRRLTWSPDGTRIAFAGRELGAPCPAEACPYMDTDIFSIRVDGTGLVNLTDTTGVDEGDPAWAPDGVTLVYSAIALRSPRMGSMQLYSMTGDSARARPLTDLPGGTAMPAWSPDGRRITFEGHGDVYVMNPDGTGLRALVRPPSPGASGGMPHEDYGNYEPTWSPDGTEIVFVSDRAGDRDLYVLPAEGTEDQAVRLTDFRGDESMPMWQPAPPPSPQPEITVTPAPDLLDQEVLVYASQDEEFHTDLFLINADGSGSKNLTNSPGTYETSPAWSSDGTTIAFSDGRNIWTINADGTGLTQLTSNPEGMDEDPTWSPDGTRIAFTRSRVEGGQRDIFLMEAHGSSPTPLTTGETSEFGATWSPDGRWIAFSMGHGEVPLEEIWKVPAEGGQPIVVLDREGAVAPAWSPDGEWIAFDIAGRIWLVRPDGSDAHPITRPGGALTDGFPAWMPDGTGLSFCRGSNSHDIWTVDADGTDPRPLVTGPGNECSAAWRPNPQPPVITPDPSASDPTAVSPTRATEPPAETIPCLREHTRRNASPPADPSRVAVYFSCSADGSEGDAVYMLERTLPGSRLSVEERLEFALDQLLSGPSAEEGERGYSIAVAPLRDGIRDVVIAGNDATVDLTAAFQQQTQCCETTQGIIFQNQLLATVFQFEAIHTVTFLSGGDCDAFWRHFESVCHDLVRSDAPAVGGPQVITIPLPSSPLDHAYAAGSSWVTTQEGLLRIDEGGNIVAEIPGVTGRVAGTDSAIWVVSDAGVLTGVDPRTNQTVATVDVGLENASEIAVDDQAVWVAEGSGGLVKVDQATNRVVLSTTVPCTTDADCSLLSLAAGEGAVWVGNNAFDRHDAVVQRIDAVTGEVLNVVASGARTGVDVAIAEGAVWAVGQGLDRLDPQTGQVVDHAEITGVEAPLHSQVAAAGGHVWILVTDGVILYQIDPTTLEVVAKFEPSTWCCLGRDLSAGPTSAWLTSGETLVMITP